MKGTCQSRGRFVLRTRVALCNMPHAWVLLSHACEHLPSQVLGGLEPSLYKGDIWYTPIKEEWYYQIEILKLEIGGQSLNLDCREVGTAP